MKKLLLSIAVASLMLSCGGESAEKSGTSLCDCVEESMKDSEPSEDCKKMEEEMMKLEGEALEAKKKEAEECAKAAMKKAEASH
tara:strand:+ start:255 stop:506 length:252 start_codon:yes stop_codon:yes gene_type:complete